MSVSRRHFLKYCAGSATVLGLEFSNLGTLEKVLAAAKRPVAPSYPISQDVQTTLDQAVIFSGSPVLAKPSTDTWASIYPCQISLYTQNEYGEWTYNNNPPGVPYCGIDMNGGFTSSVVARSIGRDAFDFFHHERHTYLRQRKPGSIVLQLLPISISRHTIIRGSCRAA